MKKSLYEKLDGLVDELASEVTSVLQSELILRIKKRLTQITLELDSSHALSLDICLNVFDADRDRTIALMQTGLGTNDDAETYQCWGDSSAQRYVVNGEVTMVPHNYCPACWAIWDEKERHTQCLGCGVVFGREVKLLLDSDLCPQCEGAEVTCANPRCEHCGFTIDPQHVVWG